MWEAEEQKAEPAGSSQDRADLPVGTDAHVVVLTLPPLSLYASSLAEK